MKCLHHNDHDGRSAGALVAEYENDYNHNDYIELDHANPIPFDLIKKDELVYIVDYSFSEEDMESLEKILAITKNIIWIDHHESTMKLIKKYPKFGKIKGIRQEGISGVGLTYMYLHKIERIEDCPKWVQLISDFDCWIYKFGDETNYLKFGIECFDYTVLSPLWMFIDESKSQYYFEDIIKKGKPVYEYVVQANREYLSKFGFECTFEGLKCLVVNKRDNSLAFGDRFEDYDIVSTFVFNGDKYCYSLFSANPEVNCRELAEKHGGGGHKGAAGFTSREQIFKN